jgi:hypothetical protein
MTGWMTERRVIQRAADEALMTPRPLPDGDHDDSRDHAPDDRDYPPGFGSARVGDPNVTVLSGISALAGGYRNRPWYQTRRLFPVLAVALILAVAAWGIIGVLRNPGDSPAVSPTGEPAPASPLPPMSRGEPIEVAPPPPPAPRPTAEKLNPPANRNGQWPRSRPSRPDGKPEIGVTRTPVTRAPLSVAPIPRQPR